MKRVSLGRMLMDKKNNTPVVELKVEGTAKTIFIWIGACEAWALAMSMEGLSLERPMTHDLVISIIDSFNAVPDHIVIHSIKNGTFFANLVIKQSVENTEEKRMNHSQQYLEIDSRPSDCLVIASKLKVPIFVTSEVILEAGITETEIKKEGSEQNDSEKKEFRSFVDNFDINELRRYMDNDNNDFRGGGSGE